MTVSEGRNMGLRAMLGVVFVVSLWSKSHGLSYDFYEKTCPQVEDIVRAGVESISLTDPSTPAALLRLMFHDCQVQGCDASILIDQNNPTMPSEMASPKNFGIRKREKIGLIKSMVEAVCPKKVSCADILILAAREAVAVSGGPQIIVPLGRRDSSSPPSYKLADFMLPPANLGVDGVLQIFTNKGMSIEESVAIVGAHTLGVTHCHNLPSHHLSNTQVPMDPALDLMLSLGCPLGPRSQNTSFVFNDPTTFIFDNIYYANVMSGHGILRIDSELPLDPRTGPFVKHFASDQDGFFKAFSSAFVKLSSSGVLTGNEGVIRASCDKI